MARGEFDYSANTGKLQIPSASPDLTVTPGSTRAGGVVKDGTLQALDTVGKVGGLATKQYAQYRKTRQAMNFQADVIEGTIGARGTEEDTFYKALATGNTLQDQHTQFMARVQTDPRYADMTAEEFQQSYQEEFTASWADITSGEPSAEELKMTSNVALAAQKEATAWHALEHGKVLHQENVRVVGEAMYNIFDSAADPDDMLKALGSVAEGGDVSEHELNALTVQMAMGFANDGNDTVLQIARAMGLDKDPRYADNVAKAQKLYTSEIASRNSVERIDAQVFLKTSSDDGTLTVDHVKAYIAKFPKDLTDNQLSSLLAKSGGNRATAAKLSDGVKRFLAGLSLETTKPGERKEIVEEAYKQDSDTIRRDNPGTSPAEIDALILSSHTRMAVTTGEVSDGYQQEFRMGATSMQVVDDGSGGTKVQPRFMRSLGTFTEFVAAGKRAEAIAWLGGDGSAAAKNITYAYRNIVEAGLDERLVVSRMQSADLTKKAPQKQLTTRQLQEKATDKLTSSDGAGVGFWSRVGSALGFDTEATQPTNTGETMSLLIDLARDKFEYADVDTWDDAFDLAMKDLPDRLTSVGTQVVLGSSTQILQRMGAKELIGDRPTHPNALLDEYKTIVQGDLLATLSASSKAGGLDLAVPAEGRLPEYATVGDTGFDLSKIRPVVHEKGSRISFVMDYKGERLETPAIPMAEIGRAVNVQRRVDDAADISKTREERKEVAAKHINTMIEDVTNKPEGLWDYGLKYSDLGEATDDTILNHIAMANQLRIVLDSRPINLGWKDTALDAKALMRLRYRGRMQEGMDEFIDNYYSGTKDKLTPQQQTMVNTRLQGLQTKLLMKE